MCKIFKVVTDENWRLPVKNVMEIIVLITVGFHWENVIVQVICFRYFWES